MDTAAPASDEASNVLEEVEGEYKGHDADGMDVGSGGGDSAFNRRADGRYASHGGDDVLVEDLDAPLDQDRADAGSATCVVHSFLHHDAPPRVSRHVWSRRFRPPAPAAKMLQGVTATIAEVSDEDEGLADADPPTTHHAGSGTGGTGALPSMWSRRGAGYPKSQPAVGSSSVVGGEIEVRSHLRASSVLDERAIHVLLY